MQKAHKSKRKVKEKLKDSFRKLSKMLRSGCHLNEQDSSNSLRMIKRIRQQKILSIDESDYRKGLWQVKN